MFLRMLKAGRLPLIVVVLRTLRAGRLPLIGVAFSATPFSVRYLNATDQRIRAGSNCDHTSDQRVRAGFNCGHTTDQRVRARFRNDGGTLGSNWVGGRLEGLVVVVGACRVFEYILKAVVKTVEVEIEDEISKDEIGKVLSLARLDPLRCNPSPKLSVSTQIVYNK